MIKSENAKIRRKIYMIWWHMKDRCYNEKSLRYELYGGRGVKMCEEWHDLEKFINDIKSIKGYSDEKILLGSIHLDKDSVDINNKIYCKEMCVFISKELNNKFKPNQMKLFKAVEKNGTEYFAYNQSEFARIHKLRQSTISDCLNGRIKKHNGWTFSYVNE